MPTSNEVLPPPNNSSTAVELAEEIPDISSLNRKRPGSLHSGLTLEFVTGLDLSKRQRLEERENEGENDPPGETPNPNGNKFIGVHMAGHGGFLRNIQYADSLGCHCLSVFVMNSRRWKVKDLHDDVVSKFRLKISNSLTLVPERLFAKCSVLLNAGAPGKDLLAKTRKAINEELVRCKRLGISYYVLHPGSTQGRITVTECARRISESINQALASVDSVTILVTNMCQQGYTVGGKFDELKAIFDGVEADYKHRVGFCLDVLAAYAAGFDVSMQDGIDLLLKEIDDTLGIHTLKAVRFMDSELPVGSHLYRQAPLGNGWIGRTGIGLLLNDSRLDDLPMFFEAFDNDYQREFNLVNSLKR